MSNKICFLLMICLASPLCPLGKKEKPVVIQVTGIVRLTGSDLFQELVIANGQDSWYIANREMAALKNLQHKTVTVSGEETVTELTFASGLSAGRRCELKNITIISIEDGNGTDNTQKTR
jgi:hypothetical protein